MNGFLEEVRTHLVQAGWSSAPAIGRLILAGHSKAYVVLNELAAKVGQDASSKGALAKLSDVWSFDTMYGSWAWEKWLAWARARRTTRFRILYRLRSKTAGAAGRLRRQVKNDGLTNVAFEDFEPEALAHCRMPAARLRDQLASIESGA